MSVPLVLQDATTIIAAVVIVFMWTLQFCRSIQNRRSRLCVCLCLIARFFYPGWLVSALGLQSRFGDTPVNLPVGRSFVPNRGLLFSFLTTRIRQNNSPKYIFFPIVVEFLENWACYFLWQLFGEP